MSRKVTVVSTSRADFAHLHWPLAHMHEHPELEVDVIATAAHLSPGFGQTATLFEGLDVPCTQIESLLDSDTDVGMAKTIGLTTIGMADALARSRPDILLLVADRYEMLAPAAAALALRIPIAHIEGGEISEGAIDDAVRNALTKMSHIHFTPTSEAARRVRALGEEPWRVHCTGAPSIDYLTQSQLPDRPALEQALGHELDDPLTVVAYHPLTLSPDTLVETDAFFAALDELAGRIVFCFPNADAGSHSIVDRARRFCAARERADLHVNLAPEIYWSLLREADLMLGNSSSGIMETASFALPTVNVGRRQQGRQRAANIIDAAADPGEIRAAIATGLAPAFRNKLEGLRNPYGDGHAGEAIATILAAAPGREALLDKKALPLSAPEDSGTGPHFIAPQAQ